MVRRAVANVLEARGANPFLEWGSTAPPAPGSVGGSVGGLHVTTESASQIAAVYGCCALLADSVASLPLRVLDKPANQVTAKETKLPPLLERPYEPISLTDWLVMFIWALALRGNFFGQIIERDDMGYPTQIMPVSPDVVRPEVKLNGEVLWFFAGKPIPTEDVFHVRYQTMPGHLLGLNPIQVMKYSFGVAHVMDVFAANVYANGADPRGVIEVPNGLSEPATKQMAASWNAAHQGPAKSSLPAVLTEGAKFNPIQLSPADQQLLEARKYSAEEISGVIFRIPPHMVGLNERSTSFGRGIEQQERTFVANCLVGYTCRVARALTECLPPRNFVDFDISHRIRGSELERAQTGSLLMLGGMTIADEIRGKFFDMPPLPNGEGKKVFTPINTELLEKALQELKEAEKHEDDPPPAPFGAVPPEGEVEAPKANGKGPKKNVPVPTK
jgi:HK97 family phage portal protein